MSHTRNAFANLSNKLCSLVFAATVAVMGNNALAQVFEETVPTKPTAAAFQMPTIKEVEKVDVAKLDMANIANEDLIRAVLVEAPRYAIPNPVNISPTTSVFATASAIACSGRQHYLYHSSERVTLRVRQLGTPVS